MLGCQFLGVVFGAPYLVQLYRHSQEVEKAQWRQEANDQQDEAAKLLEESESLRAGSFLGGLVRSR